MLSPQLDLVADRPVGSAAHDVAHRLGLAHEIGSDGTRGRAKDHGTVYVEGYERHSTVLTDTCIVTRRTTGVNDPCRASRCPNGGNFVGVMDDVRIYSRALSSTEISTVYNSGLVGYWQMSEGTGTTTADASGNGNTGTLTNGPTWVTGRTGQGINFDGSNDYVSLCTPSALNFGTGDFTISAWIKTTGNTTGSENHILAKRNGNGYYLTVGNSAGAGNVGQLSFYGEGANDYGNFRVTSPTVNDGAWHQVAVVRTSSEVRLYIDGIRRLTGSKSYGDLSNSGATAYLGTEDAASSFFKGAMDEVLVYNRALTDNEVNLLARDGSVPSTIGTVSTYLYDDAGSRVKKTEGGETTVYVNQYYEKNLTTGDVTLYYYLGGRLAAKKNNSGLQYISQDQLDSTSLITDSSGNSVATSVYYPYGGTRATTGTLGTDIRFTGQRLDGSTGLYFFGARYYDPSIGRFVSPDSIIPNVFNSQTLNRYTYCDDDPLNCIDPDGHFGVKSFFKHVGTVAKVTAIVVGVAAVVVLAAPIVLPALALVAPSVALPLAAGAAVLQAPVTTAVGLGLATYVLGNGVSNIANGNPNPLAGLSVTDAFQSIGTAAATVGVAEAATQFSSSVGKTIVSAVVSRVANADANLLIDVSQGKADLNAQSLGAANAFGFTNGALNGLGKLVGDGDSAILNFFGNVFSDSGEASGLLPQAVPASPGPSPTDKKRLYSDFDAFAQGIYY
ncbi:MAG: hypothetical protein HY261_07150 [Chloroflexi bacterium]|nr:hypothetical protein [Chloroflexota bacterium]